MKKTFSTLLICFSLVGFSQTENTAKLIAGAVASQVHGDNFGGYNKLGFSFGIGVQREIADKIYFQPEFLYTQKGSRSNTNNDFAYKLVLNYLEVPIHFGIEVHDQVKLDGGIAFGYLLKSSEGNSFFQSDIQFIKKLETSIGFGIEYMVMDSASIKLRYSISALNVAKIGNLRNDIVSLLGILYL